jgi:type II secretory pathway component PulJ
MRAIRRKNGFTLVEVSLTAALTAFLAVLLAESWRNLARPTADLIAWGQLFQEMDLAVASLASDLGGSLPDAESKSAGGTSGGKKQGHFLDWRIVNNRLQLYFDGGANAGTIDWTTPGADTIIEYSLDNNRLIRKNSKTATAYTAAGNLNSLTLAPQGANGVRIDLVFTFNNYRDAHTQEPLTRTCTLIATRPP